MGREFVMSFQRYIGRSTEGHRRSQLIVGDQDVIDIIGTSRQEGQRLLYEALAARDSGSGRLAASELMSDAVFTTSALVDSFVFPPCQKRAHLICILIGQMLAE